MGNLNKALKNRDITIRRRSNTGGTISFRVECPISWFNRTTFKQFKTKEDAKRWEDPIEMARRQKQSPKSNNSMEGQPVVLMLQSWYHLCFLMRGSFRVKCVEALPWQRALPRASPQTLLDVRESF